MELGAIVLYIKNTYFWQKKYWKWESHNKNNLILNPWPWIKKEWDIEVDLITITTLHIIGQKKPGTTSGLVSGFSDIGLKLQ